MSGSPVPALLLVAVLVASGCGSRPAAEPDRSSCVAGAHRMTIATGNASGVYHALGGRLAGVLTEHTDLRANAVETDASVRNIQQLAAGEADIAFALADAAAEAVTGQGALAGGPVDVKALSRLYSNHTHVIVRTDSGIRGMADLRGKRVSTGSPESGTEVIARRLLTAVGLGTTDIDGRRLGLTKSVEGMLDGSLDAMFWSGGLPTSAITRLTSTMGDRVMFLNPAEFLDRMRRTNPVYEIALIPAAAYGLPTDVPTIVVPNLLLARGELPANDACAVVTTMFRHRADLERTHPAARDINRDTAAATEPVPMHLGARRALGLP